MRIAIGVGLVALTSSACGPGGPFDPPVDPPPDPVSVMPPDSAFGAAPLGTTNYAIPSTGAYFVSPSGADTNAGTQAAPFKTLTRSVSAAPAGSTIVMREGSYHEKVSVTNKQLTVQNYPGEAVWLTGSSVVTGWVADGATWRHDGWTAEFVDGDSTSFLRGYIDMNLNPMSTWPDQAFRDGRPLRQVGTKAAVVPGTFYVEDATDRLYVGDNPAGSKIEASDLTTGLHINFGTGSTVRGIGARQYGTSLNQVAALLAQGDDMLFENVHSVQNAAAGISLLRGSGGRVLHSSVDENGNLGIHTDKVSNVNISWNLMERNNVELMWLSSAQGGLKTTETDHLLASYNLAQYNYGSGLWFDIDTTIALVLHNVSRNNTEDGIEYEISGHALIAGNWVYDNAARGIYVLESNDIDVFNNTTVRNGTNIKVLEGMRTSTNPDMPHDVSDVRVVNNIVWAAATGTQYMLNVDDANHAVSAASMMTADGNAYYRTASSKPTILAVHAEWPDNQKTYNTLSTFQGTGNEDDGLEIVAASDPFFVDATADNFALSAGSPATMTGVPLPADIAAVLGVTAGVAVDIGVIG